MRRPRPAWFVLLLLLCGWGGQVLAGETVYLAPERFLEEAFEGRVPEAATLWLTGEVRDQARQVLGREPPPRLRYWRRGDRSAWILEEIGKEEPITIGAVIEDGRLLRLDVLIYRETRGWEVRLPAFTRQFTGARLVEGQLDRPIDNIAGATLSVRAMQRTARLALRLSQQVPA